jgi:hypothetical protein
MATPLPADRRLEALVASSTPPQRRIRKPSLATQLRVIKAAQKAGLPVKAATIDGVALTFGRPEADPPASAAADVNEWDADLGTNPPSLRQ